MRVIALLSFYDEDAAMLRHCVSTWGGLCDVLVAVDGAYRGFPGGRSSSPPEQGQAILGGAHEAGMHALVYVPRTTYTQVEKRSLAFRIGDGLADPGDWLLVVDADEEVVAHSSATKRILSSTDLDVASVVAELEAATPVPQRRLVRSGLGVRCEGLHWRYVTSLGRPLWDEGYPPTEGAVEVPVRLRHRRDLRSPERQARSESYYQQRVERG